MYVLTVETFDGEREKLAKKRLIADTLFEPNYYTCHVCGFERQVPYRVEHVNGDRADASPGNLKCGYDWTDAGRHVFRCLEDLMQEPSRPRSDAGVHRGSPSAWNPEIESFPSRSSPGSRRPWGLVQWA